MEESIQSEPIKRKRTYIKKANLNSRPGKYFQNLQKGMTKRDAQIAAGYGKGNNSMQIESTQTFKALKYKDELLNKISLGEIATAHAENIRQDSDRGARNTAIKMAYEKIEPGDLDNPSEEKVVFVMAKDDKVLRIEQTKKI